MDTPLDQVLLAYREMFGVKTDRGNEIHKAACVEVARLQVVERSAQKTKGDILKILNDNEIPLLNVRHTLSLIYAKLAALEQK